MFSHSDEEEEDEDSLQFLPTSLEIDDPEVKNMVKKSGSTCLNVIETNDVSDLG